MSLRTYKDPTHIKTLHSMMQIADRLTQIEHSVGSNLVKLSEEQYKVYQQYLDLLYKKADSLED